MSKSFESIILSVLSKDPSIQMILDEAADYFGNPMLLADGQFRILYFSCLQPENIDAWNKAKAEKRIADEFLTLMERQEVLKSIREGKEIIRELPNGYHALRTPLYDHEEICGFIGMYDYIHPFDKKITEEMKTLQKAFQTILHFYNPFIRFGRDGSVSYFQELIQAGSYSRAQAVTLHREKYRFSYTKQLVVFSKTNKSRYPAERLRQLMMFCPVNHVAVCEQERLAVLYPYEKKKLYSSFIESFVQENHLHAAYSVSYDDDAFTQLAYIQCLSMLDVGTEENIRVFDDYIMEEVIDHASDSYPPAYYVGSVLREIEKYDKEYDTCYLETLKVYLHELGNMKSTAEKMNVHYNTVKYRISMMEQIAGKDLRHDYHLLISLILESYYLERSV